MYYIELQEEHKQYNFVTVYISVKQSLFLNYLTDKLLLFPLHIAFKEHFWKPSKPYFDTYQDSTSTSNLILLNTSIQIVLPTNRRLNNIQKSRDLLVQVLLSWLDESYRDFQINYKNNLKNNFILTI